MNSLPPRTLGPLLAYARRLLAQAGIDDSSLEARLIVEHFTKATRTEMILASGAAVDETAVQEIAEALERRREGEPVHRILGYREFYSLKLLLSPDTLEPRPDTETLVDLALLEARRLAGASGGCRILDLGTGTGAIALALLGAVSEAMAVGVDISAGALETACRNADLNGHAARFTALRSNWFDNVDGQFDLIVSNPPYIPTADVETLPRNVREHDPRAALDGGPDGLAPYRRIAAGARNHLAAGGLVAVETGYDQKAAIGAIFASEGFAVLKTARDLGGRDRAMLFGLACGG